MRHNFYTTTSKLLPLLCALLFCHISWAKSCGCEIGEIKPDSVDAGVCDDLITVEASAPITCSGVGTGTATGENTITRTPGERTPESIPVTVYGTCSHGSSFSKSATVAIIYAPDCSSGNCDTPGADSKGINSMNWTVSLGKTSAGKHAGQLRLTSKEELISSFSTPAALQLYGAKGVDIVRDNTGALSQVMANECFVSITAADEHGYQVSFYQPYAVEANLDTNGCYILKPEALPFTSYTIENPDTGDSFKRLQISKSQHGEIQQYEYSWHRDSANRLNWGLAIGDGLQKIRLRVEPVPSGHRTTRTVTDKDNHIATVEQRNYLTIGERDLLASVVYDPDHLALTTHYSYITDEDDPNFGKSVLQVNPNGSWTKNEFNEYGLISARRTGWLNAPTNAPADQVVTTSYDYTPFLRDAQGYLWPDTRTTDPGTPRIETVSLGDAILSKTLRVVYTDTMGYKIVEEARLPDPSQTDHAAAWHDPATPRTRTQYMPKNNALPWSERPELIRHPDGRQQSYTYTRGNYTPGSGNAPGSFAVNALGKHVQTTLTHGTIDSPAGLAHRTTREITIENHAGHTLQSETRLYDGADYQTIAWRIHTLNDLGQTIATISSDGSHTTTAWGCCGPDAATAADGAVTEYAYDALQRPTLTTRVGHGSQPDLFTETTYDAAGRVTSATTYGGTSVSSTTNRYDLAGRLIWTRQPDGAETTYSYTPNSTTTIRHGLTNTTVRFADGRTHYTTQNGILQQTYLYGLYGLDMSSPSSPSSAGHQTTTIYSGPDGTNSPLWQTTITDPLGRAIAEIRPGFDNTILITSNYYNTAGHLIRTESSSAAGVYAATIYEYDALGNLLLTCQDLNFNGTIDLVGPDRVTGSDSRYTLIDNDWWHETSSLIYHENDSAAIITNSITRRRLTGLGMPFDPEQGMSDVGCSMSGVVSAETHSIDHLGNSTISRTITDRDNKTTYHLTTSPDSTVAALTTTVNGLLVASRSSSGHTTSYAYDGLGRQIASQDARGAIHSRAYDQYGRVSHETDPENNTTAYAYDSFGRVIAITNALGQVTHTAYDPQGRVIATWGNTYPVAYQYDAMGRMTAMATTRYSDADFAALAVELAEGASLTSIASTWSLDLTQWLYDEPTGLLTNKLYADGKGTSYTYTPDGKLATRTWARGITTTYEYTNGSSLASITYSDDTPNVTFAYDRMGRLMSAQSGNLAHHYAYDPVTLSLVSETIVTLQRGVSNTITRATDNLGRNLSLSLNNAYKSLLHYDDVGRLGGVAWQMPDHVNAALYHYVAESDLSAGWSIHPLPAADDFAQIWEHHAAIAATPSLFTHERGGYDLRGLVGEVANSAASSHRYDHDTLGRRTARADSGTAYPNAAFDRYGYNSRSEVTSGKRYYGSDTADTTRPYGGRDFGYQYDAIGNRLTATEKVGNATLTHSYTANELNQYATINNPTAAALRGEALSNATVTVNQSLAASDTPSSDVWPWHFALDADNATSPDFPHAEIIATFNLPGTNGTALVSTQSGHLYTPPQEEGLLYDDDGNLVQDARYLYNWDAENRLIAVEERTSPTNRPLQRVEYDYDHQSRRIARRHYTLDGVTWHLLTTSDLIYDGWNEIAESITTDQGSLTNYYVWGADLSGTLQGAGGISGLIAATIAINQTNGVSLAYGYDANGNVTVLLVGGNEAPYSLAAAYEYDPFGRTIAQRTPPGHETIAQANPFRFSTKHWDNVTGLGDWGYRWYSPSMGRWLSRDTIGELGGHHLFAFIGNNSVNQTDYLGLITCEKAVETIKNYISSSHETKDRYQIMEEKGCTITIRCAECCTKGVAGFLDPNEKDFKSSDIWICPQKFKSQKYYAEVFLHEFSHAFDFCLHGTEWHYPCRDTIGLTICSELRAYYNEPPYGWYPGKREDIITKACFSVKLDCHNSPEDPGGIKAHQKCLQLAPLIYNACTQLEATDPLPPIPPDHSPL